MPWKEASAMSLRWELIQRVLGEGANRSQLAREFGVARKTLHKWLRRFGQRGRSGLADLSRRPHRSPGRTLPAMEGEVVALRDQHHWGGRKISRRLKDLGMANVPPPSTVTEILRRHGRLDPQESPKHRPYQRFEAEAPNDLWQMDFKGHFPLACGERCHPLTVLDDHSRFCLGLRACGDERRGTVHEQLAALFRRYGLPARMLVDNGPPWGAEGYDRVSRLGVWLIRSGVTLIYTSSYHPQTIGKDERFHRTLVDELLRRQAFRDLVHVQACFDPWRETYNQQRPHESLALAVPATRYRESPRPYPETPPPIEYSHLDITRRVSGGGRISFRNRSFRVGKALDGHTVALRPAETDGQFDVYFCHQRVTRIDFHQHNLDP
ncbi:MAG: IS481 family transposase [bacterium]